MSVRTLIQLFVTGNDSCPIEASTLESVSTLKIDTTSQRFLGERSVLCDIPLTDFYNSKLFKEQRCKHGIISLQMMPLAQEHPPWKLFQLLERQNKRLQFQTQVQKKYSLLTKQHFMFFAESTMARIAKTSGDDFTTGTTSASLTDDPTSPQSTATPLSSPLGSLTVTTPTAQSAGKVLDWEVWTPWTECFMSHESNQYEKMRFKLCSFSNGTDQHNWSHHVLNVTRINEQEIQLSRFSLTSVELLNI